MAGAALASMGRYQRVLAARVGPLLRRHGVGRERGEVPHQVPQPREAEVEAVVVAEQMKLL